MFNGKELFESLKFGLHLKIYKDSKILKPALSSTVISNILKFSLETVAPPHHTCFQHGDERLGRRCLS